MGKKFLLLAGILTAVVFIVSFIDTIAQVNNSYPLKLKQKYLEKWIAENDIPYSLDDVWKIREECIRALPSILSQ